MGTSLTSRTLRRNYFRDRKIPVTMEKSRNNLFWNDPFFKKSRDEFENMRKKMSRDSKEIRKRFEQGNLLEHKNALYHETKGMSNVEENSGRLEHGGQNRPSEREHGRFFTKDNEVISVKDDHDKFEILLDTSQYRPDELRVNVGNGVILVEGKHEERSEDGKTKALKHFSKTYSLPTTAKAELVFSNLSQDGVLVITAPKIESIIYNQDENVPVTEL